MFIQKTKLIRLLVFSFEFIMRRDSLKILFITYFFPPYTGIGAVRTGRTAEKLLELGHDVRVISAKDQPVPATLSTTFPSSKVSYTYAFDIDRIIYRFMSREIVQKNKSKKGAGNFKSKCFKLAYKLYLRITSVPDKNFGWYFFAKKEGEKIIKDFKPDIIYSSSSPYTSHFIAKSLSKKFKIPWVAELRDLWADNYNVKKNILSDYLEKVTLQQAKSLVTVSDGFQKQLKKNNYPNVRVIRNAFDHSDFIRIIEKKKINKKNKIKIIYTGKIYTEGQDPSPLFKAISMNNDLKKKVEVFFYGYYSDLISELTKKYSLEENIIQCGMFSREKAIEMQFSADILLYLNWNGFDQNGMISAKLFEYIAIQRPILSIGDNKGDASRIIVENNFGFFSNNSEKIAKFIRSINSFQFNSHYIEKYERTYQVKSLIKIFERTLS